MSSSVGQQKLVPLEESPKAGSFSSFDLVKSQGLGTRESVVVGVAGVASPLGGEGALA